ncbi:P2X purinoceptor 7-like [Ostrea edulis]|uniref:P2X purinoceptor 7-like n=1 Tax=Ostrea edulis TaxID=37623 RepID=UPI0024AEA820|nr:P2X purinoceptor 7-like [Ostrea edulis]
MAKSDNFPNEIEGFDDDASLDLSCGSSSFYEDEFENDEARLNDIRPFRFEPYDSSASGSDNGDEENENSESERLGNTDWCSCGNCCPMPTTTECVCCQEIEKVKYLFSNEYDEGGTCIKCITEQPGFSPACLNVYVLQIAYLQYKQQYREEIPDTSEMFRYVAYRQLARWAWGYLGQKVRVVLPSCAVNCIRNTFPSDSGSYTGFKPQ